MEPDQPRRRATRRVRWATAAVAGGALLGTGALTVGVAQAHPAATGSTTSTGSASATDDATTGSTGSTTGDRPTRPGGFGAGSAGGAHASSGGS